MKKNIKRCKKYDVKVYFSGFSTYGVRATNKDEAIRKARQSPINETEVLSNLENWFEADEASEYQED